MNSLGFLSVWAAMYNPGFNSLEFERIKSEAGPNRFTISVKRWVSQTAAYVNRVQRLMLLGSSCLYSKSVGTVGSPFSAMHDHVSLSCD